MNLYVLKNPATGLYARRYGRGVVWVSRKRADTFSEERKAKVSRQRRIGRLNPDFLQWEEVGQCEPEPVKNTPVVGVSVKPTTFQLEIGVQKLLLSTRQAEQLISQLTSLLNK